MHQGKIYLVVLGIIGSSLGNLLALFTAPSTNKLKLKLSEKQDELVASYFGYMSWFGKK